MILGQCAGFVLAGGRSSRMGTDKALLILNGVPLVQRAAAILDAVAEPVTVVGEPARYSHLGYPVISDVFPNSGPLGGIHAALTHSAVDWNIIVACDMPGLEAGALKRLIQQIDRFPQADVLVPESAGRAQPLCALYHRRALPIVEKALIAGSFKVMQAIAPLLVIRTAEIEHCLFRNVNTPAEWNDALSANF